MANAPDVGAVASSPDLPIGTARPRQDGAVEVGLRFAMSSDEPGLRDVDPLARGGDVERIAFLREAVASGRCLIAEAGFIVGFIVSAPRHFFDRDFIELLVVRDDVRRLGVGQALLRAAVERAGTSRVFSSTNVSNTVMQSVFEAGGWTLSGQLDGLDEQDPELVYFIDQ